MLLRNQILMTGVEMWVKVFSPTVSSIELVKRAERRIRRARLYYMRYVIFLRMLFRAFLKNGCSHLLRWREFGET